MVERGSNAEVVERIARLEEQVLGVRGDLGELLARIDGPPWERSLRGRVHVLEAEGAAAQAASHALAEARVERRRGEQALDEAKRRRWDWRYQLVGALAAIALAAAPYVILIAGSR